MKRAPYFILAIPICDGHDVAICAASKLFRQQGAELVYIGLNKSPYPIVKAFVEEDADASAISPYNGGHMSVFREFLREQEKEGIANESLFCRGDGTILASEEVRCRRQKPLCGGRRGR